VASGHNAPAPASAAAPSPADTSTPFSWTHQWYPVLCSVTAPGAGPHAVTLLGKDLVVWARPDGTYGCLDDACSHRAAPLSEGRVEADGNLHCAYHGWSFTQSGACARCPQAESGPALATILASPRSAVRSYPTRVEAGLVFVWPDGEPGAAARAAAAPPPVLPVEVAAAGAAKGWYSRDLPYSYDFLVENILDPAHLPVSHHGLAGMLNRANAKPVPMIPIGGEEEGGEGGGGTGLPPPPPHAPGTPAPTLDFRIASVLAPPADTRPLSRLSWWAPTLVRYRYPAGPMVFSTNLFCVPTSPGRSRVFLLDGAYPNPAFGAGGGGGGAAGGGPAPAKPDLRTAALRYLMKAVFALRPAFLGHHNQGSIFDGDGVFLNRQMAALAQATAASAAAADGGASTALPSAWKKLYYMPATCDRAVAGMRAWLDGPGGGGPTWASGSWAGGRAPTPALAAAVSAAPISRAASLDRAAQHVKHCSICQAAQARLEAVRTGAVVAGAALFLVAAFLAGRTGGPPPGRLVAALVGGAVAVAAVFRQTSRWLAPFGFMDYVHTTKGAPSVLPPEPARAR
jgi:phenylpropionate dioxygenase-like ring-hydroxylating dioxygenase large terminal subunit